jgi:hypothetical protein
MRSAKISARLALERRSRLVIRVDGAGVDAVEEDAEEADTRKQAGVKRETRAGRCPLQRAIVVIRQRAPGRAVSESLSWWVFGGRVRKLFA